MALKTIEYTVTREGITRKTEQSGGTQGEHNVTEVVMTLGAGVPTGDDVRYRVQTIDGAGGFYSTEFLIPSDGKITFLLSRDITLAGGVAYLYLVATKVVYEGEKFVSESQEFISAAMRLRFTNSGVGSPSDNAYRWGITGALLKANDLAEKASKSAGEAASEKEFAKVQAETAESYANESKNAMGNAQTYATNAQNFSSNAKMSATNAQNNANTAASDAQIALKAVEEVTKIKQQVAELKQGVDSAAERAVFSATDATQAAMAASDSANRASQQASIATSEANWIRENVGDMSNALKEIIALQELYIGGNN